MRASTSRIELRLSRRQVVSIAGIVLGQLVAAGACAGQEFPTRAVTIVVPLAAGSGIDTVMRSFGHKLSAVLGKPVLIENQTGASTMLAATNVARAPADGHTILVATSGAMAINPALYKTVNYDPANDFIPIGFYAKAPTVIMVNPEFPARSMDDLVRIAKASSPPLAYNSPGTGSPHHLTMELLKQRFEMDLTHVPYRNSLQALTDMTAGHIQIGVGEVGASLPLIRDGKLRALAVSSAVRLPSMPDTPTISEALNLTGFETVSWHILFVRRNTPDDIVNKLYAQSGEILSSPEIRKLVSELGYLPVEIQTISEMKDYVKSEQRKWSEVVKQLGWERSQ